MKRLSTGFTLIELLVSIGVLLTMSGVIIANYNTYNSTQSLKQAALTIKNDIRFIQTKSASGLKPTGACPSLLGWDITFAAGGYSYRANCNGSPVDVPISVTLPPGVTITSLPAVNPITFYVLQRGTNLSTSTTILLSGSGKVYGLQIGANGDISDLGLQ